MTQQPPPSTKGALRRLASELYPKWYQEYGYQFLLRLYAAIHAIDEEEFRTEFLIQKFADQLGFRYRERLFHPMPLFLGGTMSREVTEALEGMHRHGLLEVRPSNKTDLDVDVYSPTADVPVDVVDNKETYGDMFDDFVRTSGDSPSPRKNLRGFFDSHDTELNNRFTDEDNYVGFDYELLRDFYYNGGADPMLSDLQPTLRKAEDPLENYAIEIVLHILREYKNIELGEQKTAKRKLSVPYLLSSPSAVAAGTIGLYLGYFDLNAKVHRNDTALHGDHLLRQCPTDDEAIPVRLNGEYKIDDRTLPDYVVGVLGVVEIEAGEKVLNPLGVLAFDRLPDPLLEEQRLADERLADQKQEELLSRLVSKHDKVEKALEELQKQEQLDKEERTHLKSMLERLRTAGDDAQRVEVIWDMAQNETARELFLSALEYL